MRVWCGAVWCGMVWYGMAWYGGMVQCGAKRPKAECCEACAPDDGMDGMDGQRWCGLVLVLVPKLPSHRGVDLGKGATTYHLPRA